jgi:hypothetical protein
MHVSSVAPSSPSSPRSDPSGDSSAQYTAAGTQRRRLDGHHNPPCKVKSVNHFSVLTVVVVEISLIKIIVRKYFFNEYSSSSLGLCCSFSKELIQMDTLSQKVAMTRSVSGFQEVIGHYHVYRS